MDGFLFNEFPEVSTKHWKQIIQHDLKGVDYNDTLIWKSPEGIDIKPFYNFEDRRAGTSNTITEINKKWSITETIYVSDVPKSNFNALDKIARGADSIVFIIPNDKVDVEKLLKGINTKASKIQIKCDFLSAVYIKKIIESDQNVLIETDIIYNLVKSGNWFSTFNKDHEHFSKIIRDTRSLTVDTTVYQNAGALMQQQLAYGLSHLNEYLNYIDSNNLIHESLALIIKVAVGSNYFFEISKIRALKILVEKLAQVYDFDIKLKVYATPTKRNKTLFGYNTNMLRTTTECMSAILGGVDFVENLPYDAIYHKSNEFGDRIARNQLLILRNESGFEATSHYATGCYYIEFLTRVLAEKSLSLFKEIEKNGGFLSQLKSNKIQNKIKETSAKEQQLFDEAEKKLVGSNFIINKDDKMKDQLQLYPFLKQHPRKTLIEPILEKRLSEMMEQERLAKEN